MSDPLRRQSSKSSRVGTPNDGRTQCRSPQIQQGYESSITAINKALAIDETLSEAHSALCENKMCFEYDFDGAEHECKRALKLDPNSSLANNIYSRLLMSRGRNDEAIAEIKTAIDLEPTSVF